MLTEKGKRALCLELLGGGRALKVKNGDPPLILDPRGAYSAVPGHGNLMRAGE